MYSSDYNKIFVYIYIYTYMYKYLYAQSKWSYQFESVVGHGEEGESDLNIFHLKCRISK